jgi:hypothetical protein
VAEETLHTAENRTKPDIREKAAQNPEQSPLFLALSKRVSDRLPGDSPIRQRALLLWKMM